MLKSLRVRDLALISAAEVHFGPGLNLLTGETGSGKSLVVDALTLSLGARASTDQVRHGADRALVESVFDLSSVPAARSLLEEMGFEPEPELVLSREVGGRGASRVNGRPATPGQLRQLGRLLVDVHGQHEHQSLLDPDAQTRLLDGLAGADAELEAVAAAHAAWRAAEDEVRELERLRDRGAREREFGEWQLGELRRAALRLGEDEELAAERAVSRHAVRLTELTQGAREGLEGGEETLRAAVAVRAAAELDPRLLPLAERLEGAAEELRDIGDELRRYGETLDADPARLELLESRLAELEAVKKRFGGSLEAAVAERDRLERELGRGEDLEVELTAARRTVAERRAALEVAAAALTARRTAAAGRMGRGVTAELAGLRLEGARFEVDLEPRPELTPAGAEQVVMRFSANPGEPLAPLARVASGGELARVMLAIKTVGATADTLPTLVFDEVDAGIGGEAALQVGLRLAGLGAAKQVLVVTHLAQIAAYGDRHLLVEKAPGAGGRNLVAVRELAAGDGRAAELARMMSGTVTDKALARAHELLEEAAGR
jgi:DNA repair protein RecN (Recombination protein N)